MSDFSIVRLLAIAAVFVLAGLVKGVTGMGLPTVAMGLLGTMMPPLAAASLLILPSLLTNLWQLLAGPNCVALARRLGTMMLGVVVGTGLGAALPGEGASVWRVSGLGLALLVYAVSGLAAWQPRVPVRWERYGSPVVGVLTGLVTGATGVFVMPAVPYLQALGMPREDLVQALGLSFTVSTLALAGGLAHGGALHLGNLAASSAALAPALLGMLFGQWLRRRIPAATFRRGFFACMAALGLELLLRPWV
jgi:uncharacterized membrane protein YfcA